MVRHIDVAIISRDTDAHAAAAVEELETLGAETLVLDLDSLRRWTVIADPKRVDFIHDATTDRVSTATTVWWRRLFAPDVSDLDDEEAALVRDELPDLLRGSLNAAGVRWVDNPFVVGRAELKLYQLAVASRLGYGIPTTQVLNNPAPATEFLGQHRLIAKPMSPGVGIAPYVAEVTQDDLHAVTGCPVMLQELVDARADIRIVVIGHEAWAWRRTRSGELDWREVDPAGSAFERIEPSELCQSAVALTSALGLTMSIQDWLETKDDAVFLEANPQGQWLFLQGARELIAPPLARHLHKQEGDLPGKWPPAIRRFGADFLPKQNAPQNDGIEAPTFSPPPWLDEVASQAGALEVARRANDEAMRGAQAAEEKASRLVQVALALLTVGIALASFQLQFVLDHEWPWAFSIVPTVLALGFLALATFEAVEVDRVGMYHHPTAQDLAGVSNPTATLIAGEERGRQLARWTSNNKHSDVMQARAWFSRGLATLITGALLAGIANAAVSGGDPKPPTRTQPSSITSTSVPVKP